MIYVKTLGISKRDSDFIRKAGMDAEIMGEDDVMTYTAVFPDGIEMDIRCRGSQNKSVWTEAILFKNGCEINCTDDVGENGILGTWELTDKEGNTYRTEVVEDEKMKTKTYELLVMERRTNADYMEIDAESEEGAEEKARELWENGELDIRHTMTDYDPECEFDCMPW